MTTPLLLYKTYGRRLTRKGVVEPCFCLILIHSDTFSMYVSDYNKVEI